MLSHPPAYEYKGLTIIASQASRFDLETAKNPQAAHRALFSGNAGSWYCEEVLRTAGMTRYHCDLLDVEAFNNRGRRLLEGTKCVLLLGDRALKEIGNLTTTLGEQRGSPFFTADSQGIPYLVSYLPQDCFDMQNYEARFNPLLNGSGADDEDADDSDGGDSNAASEKATHGHTSRANWRYWLTRDTNKAVRIATENGKLRLPEEPNYVIYPSACEIIEELQSYENTELFLDIETDRNLNITCFGFSFGRSSRITVAPVIRFDYTLAYSLLGGVFRALCRAMAKNRTVAHNGSGFDFIVFPFKYRLPFGKVLADTLVMHHRCFPEVEKSLGHGLSNFTDLPYHKNEGIFEPQSPSQEQALWKYNGKDVFGLRELYYAILAYADGIPGLRASIDQANDSIYPYLLAVLQGMRYRTDLVTETLKENDRRMNHLLRMLEAAVGRDTLKEIRGKGKSAMPGSSQQCVKYFHGICGYPIIGYGKPSKKDGKRKPSLNEKNFLKLAANCQNPVIDIVLHYRRLSKESGMLKFNPWPGLAPNPYFDNKQRTPHEALLQQRTDRIEEPASRPLVIGGDTPSHDVAHASSRDAGQNG